MTGVTLAAFEDMEPIYDWVARCERLDCSLATLC